MLRINGYAINQIRYNGAVITDVTQRLKTCNIDTLSGTIDYTVEGDETHYGLTFEVIGNTVTYTWPDDFTCTITIT